MCWMEKSENIEYLWHMPPILLNKNYLSADLENADHRHYKKHYISHIIRKILGNLSPEWYTYAGNNRVISADL